MILDQNHINFFKDYFNQRTAISLGDDKAYLIESRLGPVARRHGLHSFDELILNLKTNKKDIINECVDAISTNETFFFRDLKPFKLFETEILPKIVANTNSEVIRIWSAACSSGQEPYSIAMSLLENKFKLKGKRFEIVATDISSKMVDRSSLGLYNSFEIQRGLPTALMIKYFERLTDNSWKIRDDVKKFITFKEQNLTDDLLSLGNFDCVFCRYVLIYFDDSNKRKIVEKIAQRLKPGGALILGTSETTNLSPDNLEQYSELRSVFFRK
jgi:chemotaxis protein methyltransferase CheR